jgi:hypothetical protein
MKKHVRLGRLLGTILALAVALIADAITGNSAAPTVIHVDDDAAAGGDGSGRAPYNNIADAVASTLGTPGPVVIKVEPGIYALDATIQLERSVDLRGSSVLPLDEGGLPTGAVVPGTETRIIASPALGAGSLILAGRSDASIIQGVRIQGFQFEGPAGGASVTVMRAQDFIFSGNVLTGGSLPGISTIASSGRIAGNFMSGVATGAILAGGYPASPSQVVFSGNRAVRNDIGGLLLNGASTGIPELGDQVDAIIQGNDLSENGTGSSSINAFGVRFLVLRRDLGIPGDTQSSGNIHAQVQGNRIVGNKIGVVIDAGFPYRRFGTTCDARVYTGTMDLVFQGNTVNGSVTTSGLITFGRSTAALNPATLSQWQYLHGAKLSINDLQGILTSAWLDHPELDPYIGVCANDATHEPLGNTLSYNGALVAFGRTVPGM